MNTKTNKTTPMLTWLRDHTNEEREALAKAAETSVQYLYQIGTENRAPSRKKAAAIAHASDGALSKMALLYPHG